MIVDGIYRFAALLCSILVFAQKPEYELYYKFRTEFAPKLQEANHWSLTNQQVFEAYAAKLRNDGIAETEIARRIKLLSGDHAALDADYYSRYYLDANSNFNHEPNAFLIEVVKARRPGVALDYGMGQGRNSILHFWGSETPMVAHTAQEMVQRMPEKAVRDLVEWDNVPANAEADLAAVLGRELPLSALTEQDHEAPALQDDYPVNEYYALRRGTRVGREFRLGSE